MKKWSGLCLLLAIVPYLSNAQQEDKGVHFEQALSWEQIQAKAKQEGKYIFVDCFATWCVPCKNMDKEIYPNEKVGSFYNDKFISVKAQMDTSRQDSKEVKDWYVAAHSMMVKYHITAFPSFLFLSADGEILHKGVGGKSPDDFIKMGLDALDPQRQYYSLLRNYQQGKKDFLVMPYLAETARDLGETEQARSIASDYIDNWLFKTGSAQLNSKENIEFVRSFLSSSNDKGFAFFYNYGNKVDLVEKKGYAENWVGFIIAKEDIDPHLWQNNKPITAHPDWNGMRAKITRKYNSDYAWRTIVDAQIRWYSDKKNWPEVTKYTIEKFDKYGLDTAGMGKVFLNDMIWSVFFLHSDDKTVLNKAIQWMEVLTKASPDDLADMDTYASLLYKVGRKQKAVALEQKVVDKDQKNADNDKREPDSGFKKTLEKMKKGEPTWTTD